MSWILNKVLVILGNWSMTTLINLILYFWVTIIIRAQFHSHNYLIFSLLMLVNLLFMLSVSCKKLDFMQKCIKVLVKQLS